MFPENGLELTLLASLFNPSSLWLTVSPILVAAQRWGHPIPDSTLHPRRKHGWQMGHNIGYQVSAWKIYKVTRQWGADTKALICHQRRGGFFSAQTQLDPRSKTRRRWADWEDLLLRNEGSLCSWTGKWEVRKKLAGTGQSRRLSAAAPHTIVPTGNSHLPLNGLHGDLIFLAWQWRTVFVYIKVLYTRGKWVEKPTNTKYK